MRRTEVKTFQASSPRTLSIRPRQDPHRHGEPWHAHNPRCRARRGCALPNPCARAAGQCCRLRKRLESTWIISSNVNDVPGQVRVIVRGARAGPCIHPGVPLVNRRLPILTHVLHLTLVSVILKLGCLLKKRSPRSAACHTQNNESKLGYGPLARQRLQSHESFMLEVNKYGADTPSTSDSLM